jgi:L-2-hydroxyglutarate oxidase LhgO
METVDVVVVGAGVVGLAVARALALHGLQTLVCERGPRPGEETSSRNSGVIHSGIYYPHGSLKARLCVRGRDLLYDYCRERDIAHRRCGKLIVASAAQTPALHSLHARAQQNGVTDVSMLTAAKAAALEPEVRCAAAMWCPSTGIIDVHEYLLALIADFERADGSLVLRATVLEAEAVEHGFIVRIESGETISELRCTRLVNCAGLAALDFLRRIRGYPSGLLRRAWYAKGSYFSCHAARSFKHLVYPMPNDAGLGVHATLDLSGAVRFGPDVEWVDEPRYDVDPARAQAFYAAIREYWPKLPDDSLHPAYAGVRPKLRGPDCGPSDFVIEAAAEHGVRGLINLLGIESPGLTSALALGEEVALLLRQEAA